MSGLMLCEVNALADQQKALTKESKTYAQTVFETKSWRVENDE